MIYREPPRCIFCGKVIAKAIYHQQPKDTPIHELFIGESFVNWEYIEHDEDKCAKRYFRKQKLEKINKIKLKLNVNFAIKNSQNQII